MSLVKLLNLPACASCTCRYTATVAIALLLPYADTSHNRQNTGYNSLLQNCSQQALEYSRLQGRSQHAAFCTTHTATSSHQSGESQETEYLLRATFEQQAVQATHSTDKLCQQQRILLSAQVVAVCLLICCCCIDQYCDRRGSAFCSCCST